jgi:hypothetical protein
MIILFFLERGVYMSLRIRFLTLLALLLCLSTASATAHFYSRSFSGQEGRPAEGWWFDTTDPGYWTQRDGWLASGNGKDQIVQADGYSYAVINTPDSHGWDDYEVRTRFWMKPASGELALVGRWTDRQNHYRAVLKVGEGNRSVQLQKVEKGQTSQLAARPVKLDQLGVPALGTRLARQGGGFCLLASRPRARRESGGQAGRRCAGFDLRGGLGRFRPEPQRGVFQRHPGGSGRRSRRQNVLCRPPVFLGRGLQRPA